MTTAHATSPVHEMRMMKAQGKRFWLETVWTADGHVFRKLEVLHVGDGWIRVQENGHHSDRAGRIFWLNLANLVSMEIVGDDEGQR